MGLVRRWSRESSGGSGRARPLEENGGLFGPSLLRTGAAVRHVQGDGGAGGVVFGCVAVGGEGEGEEEEGGEGGEVHFEVCCCCGREIGVVAWVESWGGRFERWLGMKMEPVLVMNGWVFIYSSSVPPLS